MSNSQIRTLRNVSAVIGLIVLTVIGLIIIGVTFFGVYGLMLFIYNNFAIISEIITVVLMVYLLIKSIIKKIDTGRYF